MATSPPQSPLRNLNSCAHAEVPTGTFTMPLCVAIMIPIQAQTLTIVSLMVVMVVIRMQQMILMAPVNIKHAGNDVCALFDSETRKCFEIGFNVEWRILLFTADFHFPPAPDVCGFLCSSEHHLRFQSQFQFM